MNEIEIIRSQLAREQSHAAEVAHACAAVLGSRSSAAPASEAAAPFREACVSYLVWALARFEERDQRLAELLGARLTPAGSAAAARARQLGDLLSRSGRSREALSRLEGALAAADPAGAQARWAEFDQFFDSAWAPRRAALEQALAQHLSVEEWRAIGAIDADSILEERERHARVTAHLPAGLPPRAASGAARTSGAP
jgi:hypothetical protein